MLAARLDYIVALFQESGIFNWFISPGSRNAPIVAALIRNRNFTLHSFPDERSSAFAAMGFALKDRYPAAFLCTSGSALANAYPAVLEAYYQRIPLIIVSADRPEDRIDQWDGQTIRQPQLFGTYTRARFHCNVRETELPLLNKGIYDTIQGSIQGIPGPVHINIALSEPIYEGIALPISVPLNVPPFVFKGYSYPPVLDSDIFPRLAGKKIALLIGQHSESSILSDVLERLQNYIPIFCDVASQQLPFGLKAWDWNLFKRSVPPELAPDLLITMGLGIVSKSLKQTLSSYSPEHIHVGMLDEVGDPFQTQPVHYKAHEADFAEGICRFFDQNKAAPHQTHFKNDWETFLLKQTLTLQDLESPFKEEALLVQQLFGILSKTDRLHLGNSMTVRYGSWAGKTQAKVYSNRGVSGIDGCLSTAVGDALAHPQSRVWVVLGDVSAVYDSNGFWTQFPPNLHVFIINNSGGRIFDFIEGPKNQESLRNYIHTPNSFNFEHLAAFYGISYIRKSIKSTDLELKELLEDSVLPQLWEWVHPK